MGHAVVCAKTQTVFRVSYAPVFFTGNVQNCHRKASKNSRVALVARTSVVMNAITLYYPFIAVMISIFLVLFLVKVSTRAPAASETV